MDESPKVEIIVVSSVDRFRQLAGELPSCRDAVLEIGCSTGGTTRMLAGACARVVAVDVSDELVDQAQCNVADLSNVLVAKVDGRDMEKLKLLLPGPDLIFLDIGGTAFLGNVTSLLRQCLRTFEPRVIVVRSFELAALYAMVTEVETPERPVLRRIVKGDRLNETLDNLLDLSHSSSASDRFFAARKLRDLGTPPARERLKEMVDDSHYRVRRISRRIITNGD